MVTLITTTLGLISSIIIAAIAKTLKCYYDDLELILRLHRTRTGRLQNIKYNYRDASTTGCTYKN